MNSEQCMVNSTTSTFTIHPLVTPLYLIILYSIIILFSLFFNLIFLFYLGLGLSETTLTALIIDDSLV